MTGHSEIYHSYRGATALYRYISTFQIFFPNLLQRVYIYIYIGEPRLSPTSND